MFKEEYILYRIKYYIKYSSLNIHEYMQDGGRTTPNPPLLLSNENPKCLKTSVCMCIYIHIYICLQRSTVPLQLMEAFCEMPKPPEYIQSLSIFTLSHPVGTLHFSPRDSCSLDANPYTRI